MTRSARALWLALLLNVTMVVSVVAYGFGNVSFDDYTKSLQWFGAGVFLSAMALALANLSGMDSRGKGRSFEDRSLEDASSRVVRMMFGVFVCGVLAWVMFVMGSISIASLLGG